MGNLTSQVVQISGNLADRVLWLTITVVVRWKNLLVPAQQI
jgi:hypothetical protein